MDSLQRLCNEAARKFVWREHAGFDRTDVASDALVQLMQSPSFGELPNDPPRVVAYVAQTVFFAYVKLYRREQRRRVAEEGYARQLPDGVDPAAVEAIELLSILKRLGSDCARLLVQRVIHGEPYAELAPAWGKRPGALRTMVHRCLRRAFEIAR